MFYPNGKLKSTRIQSFLKKLFNPFFLHKKVFRPSFLFCRKKETYVRLELTHGSSTVSTMSLQRGVETGRLSFLSFFFQTWLALRNLLSASFSLLTATLNKKSPLTRLTLVRFHFRIMGTTNSSSQISDDFVCLNQSAFHCTSYEDIVFR